MKRDITIDTIRAILVLYIVAIWHISDYTQVYSMNNVVAYCITCAAMGAFMFISGFLLKEKYRINSLGDAKFFLKKRFIRIIPLYIVAVLYYVIIGDVPWWKVPLSIIGLSSFIQPMTNTLWFVELIILFYLLYPIIWSNKIENVVLKSSILYLLFILFNETSMINVDNRFFYYFPCFVLGLILPTSFFEISKKSWKLFVPAFSFFIVLAFSKNWEEGPFIANFILMSLISIWGTHSIIFLSNLLTKIPSGGGIIKFVSYISMTAYMFHRQIIYIIYHIYWPTDGIVRILYLYVVCLPIIILLSYFIQKTYDKFLSFKSIKKYFE